MLLCGSMIAVGQNYNPADRDDTFNDFNFSPNHFFQTNVRKVKILPDGKYLAMDKYQIVKMDGNDRDPDFSTGGGFTVPSSSVSLEDFEIQSDGKIVLVGRFAFFNGLPKSNIIRLNPDGSLDTTFSLPNYPIVSALLTDLEIQPDGKILIIGTDLLMQTGSNLARLNSNGSLDTTFGTPNGYRFNKIAVQLDGKICVVHSYLTNTNYVKVSRLNTNGAFDSTFATATFSNLSGGIVKLNKLKLQDDGKLLVGGIYRDCNSFVSPELVRLNLDGTRDTSFFPGVAYNYYGGTISKVNDIVLLPSGKMYVVGKNGLINKFNADGSADISFSPAAVGIYAGTSEMISVDLFSDGKILAAGGLNTELRAYSSHIFKINPDGTRDASFNNFGKGFSNTVTTWAMSQTPDGKILVGGGFHIYNDAEVYSLVRLNADGTIDPTMNYGGGIGFGGNMPVPWSVVTDIAVQSDGKIYLHGNFNLYNGTPVGNFIRLNPDGSLDNSFVSSGFGYYSYSDQFIRTILPKPSGGVLVSGTMDLYNNYGCGALVSLSNTGAVLNNYYFGGHVTDLKYLTNGKLLLGLSQNGSQYSIGGMKRRNADMTADNSFLLDPQLVDSTVDQFLVQQDGKIIISGNFMIGGIKHGVARIFSDGALDPSFNLPVSGYNISMYNVALLPDEKILISYNDNSNIKRFERYNNNGTIDLTFEQQMAYVKQSSLTADGKVLLICGDEYQSQRVGGITRIMGDNYYFMSGLSKLDMNQNGCDAIDQLYPNMKFHVTGGSGGGFDFISNISGNYRMGVATGNYVATPVFENPSYFSVIPSSVVLNFPGAANPFQQNFCVQPNGIHPDLEVTVLPLGIARPNEQTIYKLICKNKGNQIQSGTINLNFDDSRMNMISANPAVSSQSLNNLNWNFSGLDPFEEIQFLFTMHVNSPSATVPVNVGDLLAYTASVVSGSGEDTPQDNIFVLNQTVVGSFDPNDKTCLEGNTISLAKVGDYVHYLIRFENTGSYAAENIKITDVIDAEKFDISTLLPISGSGQFITRTYDGNRVEFFFENVNLPHTPDTSNDGYVAFKIKTKTSLVSGDQFSNSAAIYFDYNTAVITNTAITTVGSQLGNHVVSGINDAILYPNPVKDMLNIMPATNSVISSISIYNSIGQLMMVIPNAQNSSSIDVSRLKAGHYILKMQSDKGASTGRFIKQ